MPGADNDEGEEAPALLISGVRQIGQLETGVDALAQRLGILSILHVEAVLIHPRDTKCVGHRSDLHVIVLGVNTERSGILR